MGLAVLYFLGTSSEYAMGFEKSMSVEMPMGWPAIWRERTEVERLPECHPVPSSDRGKTGMLQIGKIC
jgi:hypothetical protein